MTAHERSESNAKISISLSKELLDALDRMADIEGRSRSNMLQRIIAEQLAAKEKPREFDRAAEAPEHYGKP